MIKEKEYSYKIYELKNGSRNPKILRDKYTAASNKKEAFAEAKNALYRIAELEFPMPCIKKEFENVYLKLTQLKKFELLEDLLTNNNIYDYDRLTGIDDDLTEAQFTWGDTSYCSSRDASFVYLKVFSKKIKKFVIPKP